MRGEKGRKEGERVDISSSQLIYPRKHSTPTPLWCLSRLRPAHSQHRCAFPLTLAGMYNSKQRINIAREGEGGGREG